MVRPSGARSDAAAARARAIWRWADPGTTRKAPPWRLRRRRHTAASAPMRLRRAGGYWKLPRPALVPRTALLAGCGESPSAPRVVGGVYHARTVNGRQPPVQVDSFVTTGGISCASELTAAALMLSASGPFRFAATIRTTCGAAALVSEDAVSGTYWLRADVLEFLPLCKGTASVDRAAFRGGGLAMTVARNSGARYALALKRYGG